MRDSARNRSIRSSRSSPYRSPALIVLFIVVAVVLILLDHSGWLRPLRDQAVSILSPALQQLNSVGARVGGAGAGSSDVEQLRTQNQALQQRISQLEADRIKSQAVLQENEQLRKELGIEQQRPWKLLGGSVVAFTPDTGRHVLLLAVGSNQGVAVGMAVIAQEGTSPPALIGVVDAVQANSASVVLLTDYSSVVSAQVYHNGAAASGVVQGQWQRGSRLSLEQLDRASPVAPGDLVTTAGLTARFGIDLPRAAIPQDVPIGVVNSVQQEGQNQVADLSPYVDPGQVRYAWVILSENE